jgi:hypothetical protein
MPLLIVGMVPYAIGLLSGEAMVAAFEMVFTLVASGDLAVLYALRGVPADARVRDHPERAGCYFSS